MKKRILFCFIFITQFCLAQNNDEIKKEAIILFNDGNVKEALSTLEEIKDKETLENTDINIWKKHCRDILDYTFSDGPAINDSIKIVTVKTSLLVHFGVYNINSKKYIITPIYDDIPIKNKNSNYVIAYLNHQNTLIDLSGKTIIPLGNYEINIDVDNKFISLVSNDEKSIISLYNFDRKLLVNNLKSIQQLKQNYFITQNDSNKIGLFNIEKEKFLIENCDKIENIERYNQNIQEVFIKKDNITAIYNFVTNSFSAQNVFDKIVVYNIAVNVFSDYQSTGKENNLITEDSKKDRFIIVKKNSKFGVFNLTQKKYYAEPVYDSITNFGNYLQNKVWQNLKYKYPIKEDYDHPSEAVVYSKDNLFGLKSVTNKTITEAQYDEINQKSNGIFLIKKQKLWGWIFVEKNKTSIVKPQFDHIYLTYREFKDYTKPGFDKKYEGRFETAVQTCFKNKIKKFSLGGKEQLTSGSNNEKGFGLKENVYNNWSYGPLKPNRILTAQKKPANPDEESYNDETLFGLDDKNGNEIVKPFYKSIDLALNSSSFFVVSNSESSLNKYGVIDENGKIIIPAIYNEASCFDNNYYLLKEYQSFGLFDKDGKEVLPVVYKEIKVFLDNLFIVRDKDDQYKIINTQNKIIYNFPLYCDSVINFNKVESNTGQVFYDIYFTLKKGYEYWYEHFLITNDWKTRILEKYRIIEIYKNNLVRLQSQNLIGFYSLNNQKLIEPQFKEIVHQNKLIYCLTDKYFDTSIDENLNINISKDQISNVYNNLIVYEKNGEYGFINTDNKKTKKTFQNIEIGNPIYSSSQKLYKYYDNNNKKKGGFINENGEIIIKANLYDQIYNVATLNELVLSNKKFKKEELERVFICIDNSDKTTDTVDFISFYGNKIASTTVSKNNYSFDFVSKNGIVILKSSNDNLFFDLKENKIISKISSAVINRDNDGGFTVLKPKVSVLDTKLMVEKYSTKGNLISERTIDSNVDIRNLTNWNFNLIQKRENKYGIISVDEKILVPFVYDTIIPAVDRNYRAKKNNKFGIIDNDNNVILNFEYDKIDIEYLNEYSNKSDKDWLENSYHDKRLPARASFDFIAAKDNKTGILEPNLKFLLPLEYDGFIKNRKLFGNIIAKKGSNLMVYNYKGNFLFQAECDSLVECQNYNPVFYKIFKNDKQGFLDQKGNLAFPILYTKVEKTNIKNLFIIEKDSKKYIINAKGEIISKGYDDINASKYYNYLEVKINNKFGLINNNGIVVIPEIYDSMVQVLRFNYMIVSLDGKEGIIDLNFKENKIMPIKIPIMYREIKQVINEKYIIVSDFSKEGVIDLNNKIVIPIIYDSINYNENRDYFICNNRGIFSNITADNKIIQVE